MTETILTVTPRVGFTGYPDGEREQAFKAGEAVDVPADYAALLRAKNLIAGEGDDASAESIAADTKPA